MRIIIDAMGGDLAPAAIVRGAVLGAKEFDVDITLVGREQDVLRCLRAEGIEGSTEHVTVYNAEEVIDMDDDPSTATRRKKDSSMSVALRLLSEGAGDACISAGSTGALLTGATLIVKRLHGIRRGCLAPTLPNGGRGVVLLDCGANVECTAEYLLQFAFMGSLYSEKILGVESPRVGLLNIGAEESKGGELQHVASLLLKKAGQAGRLNYVGNTEARELFSGSIDVLVCDGFSGNVLLKTVEGTATYIIRLLKDAMTSSTKNKLAAMVLKKDIGKMRKMLDADEVGGTAILGISKPVFKAHGSSDARAIRSAVRQAVRFIRADVISEIEKNIEYMNITNQ